MKGSRSEESRAGMCFAGWDARAGTCSPALP
ncbi:hypothetical protein D7Y15_35305 [Corallococcus sp. AB030]|nr:hypothetical protein D7V77_29625 [Corallococcus sp. CA041A]RKI02539.1 hypothetical protein D7Y15_35305 [Corallococcus sp. AB030]RUO92187.1 hypothetical protein D7Y11_16270 [Corallococcus sp. AB018]